MIWLARLFRRKKSNRNSTKNSSSTSINTSKISSPADKRRKKPAATHASHSAAPNKSKKNAATPAAPAGSKTSRKTPATPSAPSAKNPPSPRSRILVLALGVAATTLMFGIINGVLLKPLSYPHPEQLLTLHGSFLNLATSGAIPIPTSPTSAAKAIPSKSARGPTAAAPSARPGEPEVLAGYRVSSRILHHPQSPTATRPHFPPRRRSSRRATSRHPQRFPMAPPLRRKPSSHRHNFHLRWRPAHHDRRYAARLPARGNVDIYTTARLRPSTRGCNFAARVSSTSSRACAPA